MKLKNRRNYINRTKFRTIFLSLGDHRFCCEEDVGMYIRVQKDYKYRRKTLESDFENKRDKNEKRD
ncbi:MAG: hypothetical protein QMC80_01755 [Thermoplasmatales archaeon]|nr:hypothetical protein [Thermoplasmatales archaeon]